MKIRNTRYGAAGVGQRAAGAFAALVVMAGMAGAVSAQAPAPSSAAPSSAAPAGTAGKAEIEKIVRDYILGNPEIIADAIRLLKEKKKLADSAADLERLAANRAALLNDPASPVGGNPQGDVTIVEFFDYRCGVCKRLHPIVDELVRSDPNIRRVYKDWPILGPNSVLAARAAVASRKQGKYLSFHRVLMESGSAFGESAIMSMAESVGIDAARLRRDMRAAETDEIIRSNYALAAKLKLTGTPSIVIGDTLLRGARDLASLRALVAGARAKQKR